MHELMRRTLDGEAATRRLAEDLAVILRVGDVVALHGDLGAGKSTLARAMIRAVARDAALDVPSPTFTLVQTYELPRLTVSHFDLYRLADAGDLAETGFAEVLGDHVLLVEWPDRAGQALPATRLDIHLSIGADPDSRDIVLAGDPGLWGERLARTTAIRAFLDGEGWGGAARHFLYGDAHHRVYERLTLGTETRVLMNQPAEKDDEAGRGRKTQRRAQKLAEDTRSFHGFALALAGMGFTVPKVDAHDPRQGLMLLEDLGDEFCVAGTPPGPVRERYLAAAEALAHLHGMALPTIIDDGCGGLWQVPVWDTAALSSEVSVLLDWGVEHYIGRKPTEDERVGFLKLWQPLFAELEAVPRTWCVRDYHSPNLLWLGNRTGIRRVGILDFQDTIFGSPAYDVVSLGQDARVTVPPALEADIIAAYGAARRAEDPRFDAGSFRRAYAILAAQRTTRLLGQFVRLKNRDGKPGYMQHIPRLWTYLDQVLDDAVTSPLKVWYDAVIPRDRRKP